MRETAQEKNMATARVAVPVPVIEKPATFQDALGEGWEVIKDDSHQSRNEKRREGKLTLGKQGVSQQLEVEYLGTTRGFRFAVPKFV
jgi:hypothetical protein